MGPYLKGGALEAVDVQRQKRVLAAFSKASEVEVDPRTGPMSGCSKFVAPLGIYRTSAAPDAGAASCAAASPAPPARGAQPPRPRRRCRRAGGRAAR